jgi:hypothetical protein
MTHSFLLKKASDALNEWNEGIIAPKLTLGELKDELHFHLRKYLHKGYRKRKIIVFMFFYCIQRILYTASYWYVHYENIPAGSG